MHWLISLYNPLSAVPMSARDDNIRLVNNMMAKYMYLIFIPDDAILAGATWKVEDLATVGRYGPFMRILGNIKMTK